MTNLFHPIFNSRGNNTVQVDLTTNKGLFREAVPSLELRDLDKANYHGKGASKAVSNVNDVIASLLLLPM